MSDLEIAYLNNIAHRFTHINYANRQQQNRAFDCESKPGNNTADEKRAGVAHKNLGGIVIPAQKPHMPPSSAAARIPSPEKDIIYAITINETAITAVTEEQSPSIPSVKLAEFTQPYIITTESAQNTMPVNTFLENQRCL